MTHPSALLQHGGVNELHQILGSIHLLSPNRQRLAHVLSGQGDYIMKATSLFLSVYIHGVFLQYHNALQHRIDGIVLLCRKLCSLTHAQEHRRIVRLKA